MPAYTNGTGVPLSVAVFLATDNYDYEPDKISATGLIRPVRQIVLAPRVPMEDAAVDILGLLKSRMGQAIHDGIERAWKSNYAPAMKKLGYPQQVIDRIAINPDPKEVTEDTIPVFMEQRHYRTINGKTIRGKFDFSAEGQVEDFKNTSTFTWVNETKDKDHQLQGSIYRWLAPDIITQDTMAIHYLFWDWMPGRAAADPKYPQRAVEKKTLPLLTLEETEHFITHKLDLIERYKDAPEDSVPQCNDEELWRKAPQYKYYKNPKKMTRSTKNFDNSAEAYARLAQDGNVGIVVEKPGEVVACKYCPAFAACSQKDELIADGSLQL